ncbi:MAG: hypothetical protein DRN17_06320, partial [Thermoplasmata archaeon]
LQYVKGIRAPPSAAMDQGIHFHKASEDFWEKIKKIGIENIPDSKDYKKMYGFFRQFFPRNYIYDGITGLETDRWFLKKEYFIPVAIEKYFETKDRQGFIDRLEQLNKTDFMVGELKFSNKSPKAMEDIKFELAYYASILIENGYNVTNGFVYFGRDNRYEVFTIDKKALDKMEERVKHILEGIKRGDFEPVLDEVKCMYCDDVYKDRCLGG